MSFRIFEQLKEDSSENTSDKNASIFLYMFHIFSLLTPLLLHIIFELFSCTAVARNLLMISFILCG